jgi:excisionase family DNA binding protein
MTRPHSEESLGIEAELKILRTLLGEIGATLRFRQQPEAVTVAEAARLLGFTPKSVRRLVANGTLIVVPIGHRYRIPMSEIRRLVIVGVPERSRWGKRLARPQRTDLSAPPPAANSDLAEREKAELLAIRRLVEEVRAEIERAVTPVQVLPIREAARRLSLSRTTLRELVAKGKVRTVLIGERTMVPAREIERLVTVPQPDARTVSARNVERAARERQRAWRKLKARGLA